MNEILKIDTQENIAVPFKGFEFWGWGKCQK